MKADFANIRLIPIMNRLKRHSEILFESCVIPLKRERKACGPSLRLIFNFKRLFRGVLGMSLLSVHVLQPHFCHCII